jgi:hypothetical protein
VLSSQWPRFDLEDCEGADDVVARRARTHGRVVNLGEAVAVDEPVFGELLADLLRQRGSLFDFGMGLARGAEDPMKIWKRMVGQVAATPEDQLNVEVLRGFLNELQVRGADLVDAILDEACECPTLARWYPALQAAVRLDKRGLDRVIHSLTLGRAPVANYKALAYGPLYHPVSAPEVRRVLNEIASKADGVETALEVLAMRLHSDKDRQQGISHEITEAACDLMGQFVFSKGHDPHEDYGLGSIVKGCFLGEAGAALVRELCRKLKFAVSSYTTYSIGHDELLEGLFEAQPAATLDGLFAGGAKETELGVRITRDLRGDPISSVPEDTLFEWCHHDPESRYPAIAAAIRPFGSADEKAPPRWTGLALLLLQRAPDRTAVLKEFIRKFQPSGWVGSLATTLEANTRLLDELDGYQDAALIDFLKNEKVRVARVVSEERRRETAVDSQLYERFEFD